MVGNWTVIQGDVSENVRKFDVNTFDACFCDPPYGLKFMGKDWDVGVPSKFVWERIARILKPGAHLLIFGGTRTHHRLACAIEDAGFEIRDCLMWLHGEGFPKSHNISKAINKMGGLSDTTDPIADVAKQWDGYGTALKPAWEPIILARKSLDGTVVNNVIEHGCGGLNVDGCRIKPESELDKTQLAKNWDGATMPDMRGGNYMDNKVDRIESIAESHEAGRWPSNVILDDHVGARLGKSSRFFYCAKAGRNERKAISNDHPTVKPLALTEYLSKLILPPTDYNSMIVPFSGSGSEMIGALKIGWQEVVGIELESHYCDIARSRLRAMERS